jgi:hypothetical protein
MAVSTSFGVRRSAFVEALTNLERRTTNVSNVRR